MKNGYYDLGFGTYQDNIMLKIEDNKYYLIITCCCFRDEKEITEKLAKTIYEELNEENLITDFED